MRFRPTRLAGVVLVDLEPHADERGHFARAFSAREFAEAGLNTEWPEHNLSLNRRRGTLRGLHYQRPPHGEIKVVRCVAGAVFDVVVDLRRGSPTEGQWLGEELSAENGRALYIPDGCAHGFQALADGSLLHYLMSQAYVPGAAAGVRYDDPDLAIAWPVAERVISDRDRMLPSMAEREPGA